MQELLEDPVHMCKVREGVLSLAVNSGGLETLGPPVLNTLI